MRTKNKPDDKKKVASKKSRDNASAHEFETMSQIQNRYGKGREKKWI